MGSRDYETTRFYLFDNLIGSGMSSFSFGEYDLAIVGTGPAGAACALALAGSGLRVALLEKHTFPRDKVCGDAVNIDVINQLQRLSPELAAQLAASAKAQSSHGARIYAPSGRCIDLPFYDKGQTRSGYVCRRMDFDNLLYQYAMKHAQTACFEQVTLQSMEVIHEGVRLSTSQGDLCCRMVVGADGAQSRVPKRQAYLSWISVIM